MARGREKARWRRWADVAAIVTGVYVFGFSLWGPGLAAPTGQVVGVVRAHGWWWFGSGTAGLLAVASVLVALKSTTAARILLGAAGAVLLLSLLAFREIGWLAWVAVILPALVLFAAVPFLGPMPAPEEEGKAR